MLMILNRNLKVQDSTDLLRMEIVSFEYCFIGAVPVSHGF